MKLHARNRDFQWCPPEGPFSLLTPAQVTAFSEDGGFVLDGAFNDEEIDAVVRAIDPLEAAAERKLKEAPPSVGIARADEITFLPHLVAREPALKAFSRHPVFRQLTRELIGPAVRLYWDQLVYKKPDTEAEFPWHQDNGYTYLEPQQYLTCWVALTEATESNGCPWLAPGVHLHGTLHHEWTDLGFRCFEAVPDAVPLPVRKGGIAVFSSLAPHRTGPNLTTATRKSYILQYAADGAVMHPRGQPPIAANNADWQYLISTTEASP